MAIKMFSFSCIKSGTNSCETGGKSLRKEILIITDWFVCSTDMLYHVYKIVGERDR